MTEHMITIKPVHIQHLDMKRPNPSKPSATLNVARFGDASGLSIALETPVSKLFEGVMTNEKSEHGPLLDVENQIMISAPDDRNLLDIRVLCKSQKI